MGLSDRRLLDAYDAVLEALRDCRLPLQPLVAGRALLEKHGDSPFWRSVKAEAIPLLEGCRSAGGHATSGLGNGGTGMTGSGKTDDKSGAEELPTEWDVGDRHEQQIRPMDVLHLRGVEAGLQEWITPEDEEAFADL